MQVIDYHEAVFASELTSNAKLTALAISKFYNWKEEQACWPSNKTLAKITNLSIRSIIRAKNELVSEGYLVSQRRYDMSNMYIPCVPESHTPCHNDTLVVSNWQTNNEYNNKYNNEINNEKNTLLNKIEIQTGDIIDVSSETIVSGSALRKELTPAEIDELLSW